MILNNPALLYNAPHLYSSDPQRLNNAEDALQEGLAIYRQLAQTNPLAYLPDVTITLHNRGVFYHRTQRFEDAEEAYQGALTIRRQLAQANPMAYLPNVALILHNLGDFYRQTQHFKEAEKAYQEALTTYRQLAEANPPVYLTNVAGTLKELAILSLIQGDTTSAQAWIADALMISRNLWRSHPTGHGDRLAKSVAVKVLILEHVRAEVVTVCEQLHEMLTVAYSDDLKQWAQAKMEVSCGKGRQP